MEKESIMKDVIFNGIYLNNVNAKILKQPKKASEEITSNWEYNINNIDEKNLEIFADVHTQLKGMFTIKASYTIDFILKKPIAKEEIESEIANILYYCGSHHTLMSSFLTNAMFRLPIPVPPNIDENEVRQAK